MKFIILGITFLLLGCTNSSTQNTSSLKDVMAYGVITELNNQDENIYHCWFWCLWHYP